MDAPLRYQQMYKRTFINQESNGALFTCVVANDVKIVSSMATESSRSQPIATQDVSGQYAASRLPARLQRYDILDRAEARKAHPCQIRCALATGRPPGLS